jgi:hypothetical protein
MTSTTAQHDIVSDLKAYENGEMEYEDVITLFQNLLDTGTIYHLQGSYGHQMQRFLNSGEVRPCEKSA